MKNRVEEFKKRIGFNQDDLAKTLKVSRQTIRLTGTGRYNTLLEKHIVVTSCRIA